jgi:2-methylcitrate dehydratase PrpD
MTLADQLAQHCWRPIQEHDLQRATQHVMAWTGAAALAAATPTAAQFWQGLQGLSSTNDPWHRLMFEASLGSLFEMDDTHRQALVHPAPVIVPVAMAIARQQNATGQHLLQAIVRGYEAMIRVGMSVGPAHYQYWHNTSTCGPIGAAVAAASLLNLSVEQTSHAIRLALVQTSGLWQTRLDSCDAKPWHLSRAAQTGVQAAFLAQAGLTGPAHAFEGEKGFFAATCPDAQPDKLTGAMTDNWQIHATSFKPWAACRHAHPTIDAALGVREIWQQHHQDLVWRNIDRIHIYTYQDAIAFCDRPHPTDTAQARFSLQHAAATTLLHGSPTPAAFEAPHIADTDIAALRHHTQVGCDADLQQRYPQHFGATVTVQWRHGHSISHTVYDTWGDPERPLQPTDLLHLTEAALHAAGWDTDCRQQRLHHIQALALDTTGAWSHHIPPLNPTG